MIRAKYNKNNKCTKCEITGDKSSIINEFGTILNTLMREKVLDTDGVLFIMSKVIKDNDLEEQLL